MMCAIVIKLTYTLTKSRLRKYNKIDDLYDLYVIVILHLLQVILTSIFPYSLIVPIKSSCMSFKIILELKFYYYWYLCKYSY